MNLRQILKDLGLVFTLLGGVETARTLYNRRFAGADLLTQAQINKNRALEAAFEACKESENKINDWINSDEVSKSSMVPDFITENIDNSLENFRNYLSSLDNEQLLSLLHIIFCISILIALYNMIMVFYSDQIIKYFDLENKYPKFGRFLKIRNNFKFYYFTLNFFIILVVLLFLLVLNTSIFLKIF